jgi:hypothetical protein
VESGDLNQGPLDRLDRGKPQGPAVSLFLRCPLTSTYRDARRGDRTGYYFWTLNSIQIKGFEGKCSGIGFAVGRHLILLVQGESSVCRGSGVGRVESPANVVQDYTVRAGRPPYPKANVSLGRRQERIFKLGPVTMPLVKGLVKHLAACRVDHMP